MQIGLVRVDRLKRMASLLKRRLEGCRHTLALERLSRTCGFKDFQHALDASASRRAYGPLLPGSRGELIDEWKRRLDAAFMIDISSIVSTDELGIWFDQVFVPRDQLVVDAGGDGGSVMHVVDPRIDEADWRDAEFRRWIQGVVERESDSPRAVARRDIEGADPMDSVD